MSVFDGTILNEEILKRNHFLNIGPNEWKSGWLTSIINRYRQESCVVSIRVDIDQNVFNVYIVVSTPYTQYLKRMRIEDSVEFHTLLHRLEKIEFEYLTREFQIVTAC